MKLSLPIPISKTSLVGYCIVAVLPFVLGIFWPFIATAWFIYFSYFIYRHFLIKQYVAAKGKTVFITGCDSGFGYASALELAHRGCYVFAGCLFPDGIGAKSLQSQGKDRIRVVDLDVTNQEKVQNCANIIGEHCKEHGLWGLFNNAGVAYAGEIEWAPLDQYRKSFEVNVFGTLSVTKSVLPLLRKSKGRVLTITSGIARCVQPGRSAYCMSKASLEAMADCLRFEMKKFQVKSIILTPGNFVSATQVFKGLATNLDTILESIEPSVKKAYGIKYLKGFRESICGRYVAESGAVSMDPVVKDIADAFLLVNPRERFTPAQFYWLVWWLANQVFPTEVCDWFVYRKAKLMPKVGEEE